MKKYTMIMAAVLTLCGSANANSWRVCSKPEMGAQFLSVAAAMENNSVFAGDTLYLEPGHLEPGDVTLNKRLHLIGPGHSFVENNINVMDPNTATMRDITLNVDNATITGVTIIGNLYLNNANTSAKGCHTKRVQIHGSNNLLQGCQIDGYVHLYSSSNTIVENNYIYGRVYTSYSPNNITIRNNTIIDYCTRGWGKNYLYQEITMGIGGTSGSRVYNNIIIRIDDRFEVITNDDQTVDTIFAKDYILDDGLVASDNLSVYNNVMGCKATNKFMNCKFNQKVEDVLIWDNANSIEERFKHKSNGPAVGAGVNGTTCGAYGVSNGGRAYQPSGIPQYRPYIYDAEIDETPSSDNTINASFKIKVQQ